MSTASKIELSPERVAVAITDTRPALVSLLVRMTEREREQFADDAWNVGVRALESAHRGAEEARLKEIGASVLGEVGQKMDVFVRRQEEQLVSNLRRYFDPNEGQVSQRIQHFVGEGGEIAKAMDRYLGPETGALAKTLARELGNESPLLKRLSPTDSDGILKILEERVAKALADNQVAMAKALDPLSEGGAVARFFVALRAEIEKADDDRAKHIEKHAKAQDEALTKLLLQQNDLDKSLRESVARLEERKRGEARSARGGATFEEAAIRFVKGALLGAPIVVDATGNTAGAMARSKVGDIVLRYSEESAYAGASLVIEAKHDQSYTVERARKELEEARSNRTAHVGIFLMAKSHAPASFPSFARYGKDILVVWDSDDELTDPYFHAALLLGLGLTARGKKTGDEGDLRALAKIEGQIQDELKRHEKMAMVVERMRKDTETLADELRKGADGLGRLLKNAKQTLTALHVELEDPAMEGVEPILLPAPAPRGSRDGQANDVTFGDDASLVHR